MSAATSRRVLLVGGTSEIGLAIVRRLAQEGPVTPVLMGRDRARLEAALEQLHAAGCSGGTTAHLEAEDLDAHDRVLSETFASAGPGGIEVVVMAVGVLGAREGLDADPVEAAEVMRVDFLASGSLVLASLRALRAQEKGTLVVLSTVAAERPRASNAVYGAAKAGLDSLAQGLADSVAGTPVRVLVVRPGFVTTRMTRGLKPAPFATTAEAVAEATVKGLRGRAHTVWVPPQLRYVFAVLRHLPRPLYRRLPL
jgi:decaprenylphospho-beta-D-erythro-pentofuranosid-2-ulose 2-reductase